MLMKIMLYTYVHKTDGFFLQTKTCTLIDTMKQKTRQLWNIPSRKKCKPKLEYLTNSTFLWGYTKFWKSKIIKFVLLNKIMQSWNLLIFLWRFPLLQSTSQSSKTRRKKSYSIQLPQVSNIQFLEVIPIGM